MQVKGRCSHSRLEVVLCGSEVLDSLVQILLRICFNGYKSQAARMEDLLDISELKRLKL